MIFGGHDTRRTFSQRGFTVVELLIVITVIGILAALVLNSVASVQARARDTKDIDTVNKLARSMIAYEATNGVIPTYSQLVDPTWQQENTFNSELLQDSKNKTLQGLPGSDLSTKVRILIPSVASADVCGAILQVKKENDQTMYTKLVDTCPTNITNNGFNNPPSGMNCPTSLNGGTYTATITEDAQGFCSE